MKNKMNLRIVTILLVFVLFTGQSVSGADKIYAIKNATIITVSGPTILEGTLIIEGDKIAAIGQDVAIPPDAEIIDGSGLHIYPGMIDAYSQLGLYEVGAVAATVDAFELGTYNAHIKAAVALNPHSVHIPITRVNGVTSALVAPSGGIISGQCAFINLNGWTPEQMVIKTPIAIAVRFPRLPQEDDQSQRPGSQQKKGGAEETQKQIDALYEVFKKANRYAASWDAYSKSPKPPAPDKDLMLEALGPVVKGDIPVIIAVDAEKDIKNAVEFVDSLNIRAIFGGVNDGWKVAKLLKKHDIPVLVGPVFQTPGAKDPYDARYANAAILREAGVKIGFLSGGAADARNLPYRAGMASAFGLPKEEALKAVTIYPAEIFGMGDLLGSLEVGKMANVIVTDGDPLEMWTQVKQVFVGGEKIPMDSKHTELYEKFKDRPKTEKK